MYYLIRQKQFTFIQCAPHPRNFTQYFTYISWNDTHGNPRIWKLLASFFDQQGNRDLKGFRCLSASHRQQAAGVESEHAKFVSGLHVLCLWFDQMEVQVLNAGCSERRCIREGDRDWDLRCEDRMGGTVSLSKVGLSSPLHSGCRLALLRMCPHHQRPFSPVSHFAAFFDGSSTHLCLQEA